MTPLLSVGASAGRQAPEAAPIAERPRVGQSLIRVIVMVWSGAYCGMALPGRAATNSCPSGGSPKRVEKSSATTGLRVAQHNLDPETVAGPAGTAQQRLFRLALCWESESPLREGPAQAPSHPWGNGSRRCCRRPAKAMSWMRRPAPVGSLATSRALAGRGLPAAVRPTSSACGRCREARPLRQRPGKSAGSGACLVAIAQFGGLLGRIAEIVDAEAERPLGAGAGNQQRGDPHHDGDDQRHRASRPGKPSASVSTIAGKAASAARGATAHSGPSISSISIRASSSANIRNWTRIAATASTPATDGDAVRQRDCRQARSRGDQEEDGRAGQGEAQRGAEDQDQQPGGGAHPLALDACAPACPDRGHRQPAGRRRRRDRRPADRRARNRRREAGRSEADEPGGSDSADDHSRRDQQRPAERRAAPGKHEACDQQDSRATTAATISGRLKQQRPAMSVNTVRPEPPAPDRACRGHRPRRREHFAAHVPEAVAVERSDRVAGRMVAGLVADDPVVEQRPAGRLEEDDVGRVGDELGEIGADRIGVGPMRRARHKLPSPRRWDRWSRTSAPGR